jgi:putative inorganic carbon (HCO3(-)) transporter
LYPGDYAFTHAHNIYLQVALDLGLLGLIGYMGLLVAVFRQAWRVYRRSDAAWLQAGAASLLSGLLAYQVYGLADAITLGAKPGIFWWMLMALLVSARPDLPSKRL